MHANPAFRALGVARKVRTFRRKIENGKFIPKVYIPRQVDEGNVERIWTSSPAPTFAEVVPRSSGTITHWRKSTDWRLSMGQEVSRF
jgi:hypothetical protein